MATVLDEILAHKRTEVERARRGTPLDALRSRPGYNLPRRNFFGAVTAPRPHGPNLIAEVKRSSPSAGVIRSDFDPVAVARDYEAGGAQALSVLTDEKYFDGRLTYIEQVKAAVGLPVLRKDFIIDEYQVHESRAAGADAILLIADALPTEVCTGLLRLARTLELCVLLEVHATEMLSNALAALPSDEDRRGILLGINNRDLHAQRVVLETTERLAPLIPPGIPIVAESGIRSRRDVQRMHAAGARALLIGEALMRSGDARRTIRELLA